jgi:hypothetical protein
MNTRNSTMVATFETNKDGFRCLVLTPIEAMGQAFIEALEKGIAGMDEGDLALFKGNDDEPKSIGIMWREKPVHLRIFNDYN